MAFSSNYILLAITFKLSHMKSIKKIFIFVLLASSVIGLYKMNKKKNLHSDFTLKNVEALAIEEGDIYLCLGKGDIICPLSGEKVEAVFRLNK